MAVEKDRQQPHVVMPLDQRELNTRNMRQPSAASQFVGTPTMDEGLMHRLARLDGRQLLAIVEAVKGRGLGMSIVEERAYKQSFYAGGPTPAQANLLRTFLDVNGIDPAHEDFATIVGDMFKQPPQQRGPAPEPSEGEGETANEAA